MTPSQHTMLNRAVEKIASLPLKAHSFVFWLSGRRNKNPHIVLNTDEQRRLIALHGQLLEQGLVEELETA